MNRQANVVSSREGAPRKIGENSEESLKAMREAMDDVSIYKGASLFTLAIASGEQEMVNCTVEYIKRNNDKDKVRASCVAGCCFACRALQFKKLAIGILWEVCKETICLHALTLPFCFCRQ